MEARRVQEIKPFLVMEILERAHAMERSGADVVHLEVGEPDFEVPEPARRAAMAALERGGLGYTHSLGLLELRQAVAGWYEDRYGVTVDPERVVVTNGTSPAMSLVFGVLLDPGDEVILSDPGYACYPTFVRFSCGEPVFVPTREEDGFQYRPASIRAARTPRTKAVMINSPSNPTGVSLSGEALAAIADIGLAVVSDEVYHGLTYEGEEHSILEYTDEAFVLGGFSKLFAMTGLRLGYCIAPQWAMPGMRALAQNLYISANEASQWAGVAALTQCHEHVAAMRTEYDARRRLMLERVRAMGLGVQVTPTGAFYVLANARHVSGDSLSLAFEILERAQVGVTPGVDFGPGAEGFLRFSYATSREAIAEGMDRLEVFFRGRS